jgi:Transposase DDE domain
VTAANVNDITAAKPMPIDPGATYVFDLGYYDFSWWGQLDGAGCRLVTRFKANTPLREAKDMPLAEGSDALSDRIGFLPARQCNNRKNPMQDAVREIVVETETGKRMRILTNDLDAAAQEIADLYKRRWQIELFFRVMKQTLKITKFLGRSENAVRTQIAVALIAILAAPPAARHHQSKARLPRTRSTRARQFNAQKRRLSPARRQSRPPKRGSPTATELEHDMNRTAVGLSRPSTRLRPHDPALCHSTRASGGIEFAAYDSWRRRGVDGRVKPGRDDVV